MKVRINPLEGKYYGTEVELEEGSIINIWVMGDYSPSQRELDNAGVAMEDWEACDEHYESKAGYDIAKCIMEALSKLDLPYLEAYWEKATQKD